MSKKLKVNNLLTYNSFNRISTQNCIKIDGSFLSPSYNSKSVYSSEKWYEGAYSHNKMSLEPHFYAQIQKHRTIIVGRSKTFS